MTDPTETWRATFAIDGRSTFAQLQDATAEESRAEVRRLTAELGSALGRLNEQRSWQVADRTTGPCASCDRPIWRGQAFQPLADAKGYFSHVACPLKED